MEVLFELIKIVVVEVKSFGFFFQVVVDMGCIVFGSEFLLMGVGLFKYY